MKASELMKGLMQGQQLIVAKYWAGRVEEVNYRDKQSGQTKKMRVVRETILLDGEAAVVTRILNDDKEAFDNPFKRGESVVVFITSAETIQGFRRYQGKIEPFEEDVSSPSSLSAGRSK